MKELRPAIVSLALLSILTGLVYPLLVTGVAQLAFPAQANGSLVFQDGKPLGATLIGQPFEDPRYFWGRLSATAPFPYNAGASSGSNYGPLSDALRAAVQARIDALRATDPGSRIPIPVDLVTASASGLDPHVSPAAARYQVSRVARTRGLDPSLVAALAARHTEGRQWRCLGESRVNVLTLNLALDALPVR